MRRVRLAVLTIIAACTLALGAPQAACGGARRERHDELVITGRPVIRGNAPFSYVCILSTDGGIYYVFPDCQAAVRRLPPRLYRFHGRLHRGEPPSLDATRYPDGTLIVERWEPLGYPPDASSGP